MGQKLRYALAENLAGLGAKRNATECAPVSDEAYTDGVVCAEACRALTEYAESLRPFFLAVGFRKPHLPYCAPSRYWDLYDRNEIGDATPAESPAGAPELATRPWMELQGYRDIPSEIPGELGVEKQRLLRHGYYACVSYVDAQIGKLPSHLEKEGLQENTLVVVWGDHGYHLGELGLWTKCNNYELGTRTPLIVHDPRAASGRGNSNALVDLVDLYPTLTDLCGIEPPQNLVGISLRPLLDDPSKPGKAAVYSQFPRDGDRFRHRGHGDIMGYTVRTDRYRYIEWRRLENQEVVVSELYDYAAKSYETENEIDSARSNSDFQDPQDALRVTYPPSSREKIAL